MIPQQRMLPLAQDLPRVRRLMRVIATTENVIAGHANGTLRTSI
jgi:hypothetical protein